MKRTILIFISLLLSAALLTGCGGGPAESAQTADTSAPPTVSASPASAETAALTPAVPIEDRVDDLLGQMNLDEKIGQMIQVEKNFLRYGDIGEYCLGSVLSGGGSAPPKNDLNNWNQMIKGYQQEAASTRLGIPLIYGIDAVHGNNTVAGAVVFPHNIGLGAADDPALMEAIGAVTAEEMLATGILWNFAPCVAVAQDPRWGRYYESYGGNSDVVTELSGAYSKGLAGYDVAACMKHFAADGAARWGTGVGGGIDQGDAELAGDDLAGEHLPAYKAAVDAGVQTVMASFSSINGTKCHANADLIQGTLKDEWGFAGFVVGDYNAIHQLDGTVYDQVVTAVNSGVDMMMEAEQWHDTIEALKQAAEDGAISPERIDDAVRRILRVKFQLGLFENPLGDQSRIQNDFASDAHREVAQQAVRESLVLLKNENEILPIQAGAKVYVSGPAMDSVGIQCGGWTLTWQGVPELSAGTTILDGLKEMADKTGGEIITNKNKANDADIAVVVIGETPYAEYVGDDGSLALDSGLALSGNMKVLTDAYALGKPVVVIMVSGRPRIVTEELPHWNAFVEAWLPGSEGAAVADVLYGEYGFTGTLPVTWPENAKDLPVSGHPDNVLFPYKAGIVTR